MLVTNARKGKTETASCAPRHGRESKPRLHIEQAQRCRGERIRTLPVGKVNQHLALLPEVKQEEIGEEHIGDRGQHC